MKRPRAAQKHTMGVGRSFPGVNSYGRCTGVRNLLVRCVYVETEW